MSQSSTIVNDLYNTTSEIGSTMSTIYLVIGIVIAVIILISAIISFMSKPEPTIIKVNGENTPSMTNPTMTGIISSVIALCIIGFSYLNYYLAKNNKAYASLEGVQTFRNLIR